MHRHSLRNKSTPYTSSPPNNQIPLLLFKLFINHKKKSIVAIISFILLIWFLLCLPHKLFNDSYSTVLNDSQGNLLSAKIATDGQWRFPESKQLNPKFGTCILVFEDEYFFKHPGINPVSIWRAIKQNNKAGKDNTYLDSFRWGLEELRISLFAQELKTPYPVSVKRLQKIWTDLHRW